MTRAALALLCACALLALSPAAAPAAPSRDPLRSLGADSPLCAKPRTAEARDACRASGAVEQPYPLDRYRFDWHINTGPLKVENNLNAGLQFLAALLWQAVLWGTKLVLLAFQWAFSLDLLGDAMDPARRALERLHRTLGEPWLLAAMSLLGLWALWNGILRRRTVQTAGGLAVSVAMMALALAAIARPAETVGAASAAVSQIKLGVLAGATRGSVEDPRRALEDTSQTVFDTLVLRPWCAVQFGDVDWCLARAAGDRLSHAERFLRYEVGSKQRNAEYEVLADPDYTPGEAELLGCDVCAADDDELKAQLAGYQDAITADDRTKVDMQRKERTLFRLGLIAVILVGLAGWMALIGWLSVQSLLQAIIALVYLLLAPVMLFAPAFGERGRATFAKWGTSLLGALASGVVYALLLAVTITIAGVLATLEGAVSWMAAWLLQLLFLWGVFFKRAAMLAWLSGDTQKPAGDSLRWTELHSKARMAKLAAAAVAAPGGGAVSLVGRHVAAPAPLALANAQRERAGAVRELADAQLRDRAREQLHVKYDQAHARLARHNDAQRALPEMRRRRDKLERELASPKLSDERRGELAAAKGRLTGQIKARERHLMPADEAGVAARFVETADRNLVEQGERFSRQQVDLQLAGLRDDLAAAPAADDSRHAWRAQAHRPGIALDELEKLSADERADLHRQIDADLARDRALLAAVPADPQAPPRRAGRRAAEPHLPRPARRAARLEARAARLGDDERAKLHTVRSALVARRARRARAKLET